jgi:hypothetical protein
VQQVLAVDEARRLAMLHSDVSALDLLLAEDATIFWGDDTADDKASTLALLRSGRLRRAGGALSPADGAADDQQTER